MCVIDITIGPNCPFPNDCAAEFDTLWSCKGAMLAGGTCSDGPGGSCSCDLFDSMGFSYESECTKMGPMTPNDCTCKFNGQTIGWCSFDGPPECDPFANCCRLLLGVPAFP